MILNRLFLFSLVSLAWTTLVIVWGAFVRATGSGAGCGDHWPLCNGTAVPLNGGIKTFIEFSHRLTSGVCLLLVVFVAYYIFKTIKVLNSNPKTAWPKNSVSEMKRLAVFSVIFIVLEAAIGAGIVLFELVEFDASLARGVTLSLHLVNTFLLLYTQTGIVLKSKFPNFTLFPNGTPWNKNTVFALAPIMFVGVTGGIAALGSTVFPESKLGGVSFDLLEETKHMFVRLRGIHPFAAIATTIGICIWAFKNISTKEIVHKKLASSFMAACAIGLLQLFLGTLNIYLKAPIWMQLVHLLFADALFVAVVCILFFSREN
jgi:heme a synthase